MRGGDGFDQRRHALVSRTSTEAAILHASVSGDDANDLDQAVAGDAIAVPDPELFGHSDVPEEMLDI
jgi:hypothetical protein